jgi:hypothetical protein
MIRPLAVSALVREKALLALPILVHRARQRRTITYGELASAINWHHRPLRYALEYIRDDICRPRGLPLITVLVVRQGGLPGESYLPQGASHPERDADDRAEWETRRDQVFAYPYWDDLLAELGLQPVVE